MNKSFIACVMGADPETVVFRSVLSTKVLRGRSVVLRDHVAERDIDDCDLLFIAASERKQFLVLLNRIAAKPMLTIGDWLRFAGDGGMIGF